MKDLICLVADKSMESVLRSMLKRNKSLSIRDVSLEVFVHPHHDPGVFKDACNFLSPFTNQFHFALIMFDREGSGQEKKSAKELESLVQHQLDNTIWKERSGVIVIDPELEAWVWSDSPHVSRILGINYQKLRDLLERNNSDHVLKPSNPKELMDSILRQSRIPRSSSLFADLARKVSFRRCFDPAFCQLREYLVKWFGE